jgi:hypothetical protein
VRFVAEVLIPVLIGCGLYRAGRALLRRRRLRAEERAPWRRTVRSAGGSLVVQVEKPGQDPHVIKVLLRGCDTMTLLEAESLADELAAALNSE